MLQAVAAALYNDFAIVADRAHPVLKDIRQSLLAFGADGALMSGSGSTLFGLFASPRMLRVARRRCRRTFRHSSSNAASGDAAIGIESFASPLRAHAQTVSRPLTLSASIAAPLPFATTSPRDITT